METLEVNSVVLDVTHLAESTIFLWGRDVGA